MKTASNVIQFPVPEDFKEELPSNYPRLPWWCRGGFWSYQASFETMDIKKHLEQFGVGVQVKPFSGQSPKQVLFAVACRSSMTEPLGAAANQLIPEFGLEVVSKAVQSYLPPSTPQKPTVWIAHWTRAEKAASYKDYWLSALRKAILKDNK